MYELFFFAFGLLVVLVFLVGAFYIALAIVHVARETFFLFVWIRAIGPREYVRGMWITMRHVVPRVLFWGLTHWWYIPRDCTAKSLNLEVEVVLFLPSGWHDYYMQNLDRRRDLAHRHSVA